MAAKRSEGGRVFGESRTAMNPALKGSGRRRHLKPPELMALMAIYGPDPGVHKGIQHLIESQWMHRGWNEPWFTGTGFPGSLSSLSPIPSLFSHHVPRPLAEGNTSLVGSGQSASHSSVALCTNHL
jgi:hypothetical protein